MGDEQLRAEFAALKSFLQFGDTDQTVWPDILESLRSIGERLQNETGLRQAWVISALEGMISRAANPHVRATLLQNLATLGQIGELSSAAIKPLIKILRTPDLQYFTNFSANAIIQIAKAQPEAWKDLCAIFL